MACQAIESSFRLWFLTSKAQRSDCANNATTSRRAIDETTRQAPSRPPSQRRPAKLLVQALKVQLYARERQLTQEGAWTFQNKGNLSRATCRASRPEQHRSSGLQGCQQIRRREGFHTEAAWSSERLSRRSECRSGEGCHGL